MEGREYPLFAPGHRARDPPRPRRHVRRATARNVGSATICFAGVVVTGVLVAALVLYPRLRAGLRALLAFCLGVLIATAGAMHSRT